MVDANVLYSRTCRDWLILLELGGSPHKTYWTEDILAETLYRLRRRHPAWSGAKISTIRDKIAGSLEGGRVEDLDVDGTFPGEDPHDQHVHAAALACRADCVLTADTGFSDVETLDELPYEVYEPDDFFVLVDDSSPDVVRAVASQQVSYFLRRHGSADLCAGLRAAGCPDFAERVRRHLQTIDLRAGEKSALEQISGT